MSAKREPSDTVHRVRFKLLGVYRKVMYGARAGDVTPLLAHQLLAAHRRLVPIDHSHSCSPHQSAYQDVAGFSRFVRGVKWRHHTLGGKCVAV